jgi:cardiolipin synthase A/B
MAQNSRPGPSFARGLWRVAAADVSSGNRVCLLRDGPPTFDAMCEMIDGAQSAVDLEQYIFRGDEVGQRFADALTKAAARGVTCRVLVDWIGIRGTPRGFLRRLMAAGITVRVFNPLGFRRWFGVVPRDHRKLLVVDGARGVTGGIGIGKEWRTGVLKKRRSPWRDTAVCI